MTNSLRVTLFMFALVATALVVAVLLDVLEMSEAKEWGLRIGGVVAVSYLLVLVGSLLFTTHNHSK